MWTGFHYGFGPHVEKVCFGVSSASAGSLFEEDIGSDRCATPSRKDVATANWSKSCGWLDMIITRQGGYPHTYNSVCVEGETFGVGTRETACESRFTWPFGLVRSQALDRT